jgi:hypothetical protein
VNMLKKFLKALVNLKHAYGQAVSAHPVIARSLERKSIADIEPSELAD